MLQSKKPFMLLMPLPALQGKQRFKYFSKGVELLVFDDRISYFANGHTKEVQSRNSFASIYFCHKVLPEKLIFRKLKSYQEETQRW